MKNKPLYAVLASTLNAWKRCKVDPERYGEWEQKHDDRLKLLVDNFMPSGSGIDTGTTFDLDASNDARLVFHLSFHHMNDGGMYDGWTEHTVRVWPTFDGIRLTISGPNRNEIKDYLHDTYYWALCTMLDKDDKRVEDPPAPLV